MSSRPALIDAFLGRHGWSGWSRKALPVDASRRRYERLTGPLGKTLILMDAPPDQGEALGPFLSIGAHLRGLGLSAPKVLAQDLGTGLLMLEDLGEETFSSWIARHPEAESRLYQGATDLILAFTEATPPEGLTVLTPALAGEMISLYAEWAAPAADAQAALNLQGAMSDAYARLVPAERCLSLRDFHAENLIWRPDRAGNDQIGLLDFQDAFLAPRCYDLASLLRDPRRAVGAETQRACLSRFAGATGQSVSALDPAFACVAAQRNLRILGIFHRLIRRDGKPRYSAFLPHLTRLIEHDLSHPALAELRRAVLACGAVG